MAFPDFFIDLKKSEKSASGIADFFNANIQPKKSGISIDNQ